MRFSERVVVITGAAHGIGRGCAEVFHEQGGRIAILDKDEAAGEKAAQHFCSKREGSARFYGCNVAETEALISALHAAAADFGRVDCLINNVGVHPPDMPIDQTSIEELRRVMDLNFTSTFVASQTLLPYLRVTRGTIVNISSMTAVLGQKNSAAYAASKGAQLSFTKALALEEGRGGVRVNAVLPSNIDTPLMQAWAATLPNPESALQKIADLQVFGRMGSIEEIGRVCLFLATDDSSFITGQGIEVEGGSSLDY